MRGPIIISFTVAIFFCACSSKKKQEANLNFEVLKASSTGLHFNNKLTATDSMNIFSYLYFYNGSGVATADFNNDGWQDVFFAANQSAPKLFINKQNMQFDDLSKQSLPAYDSGWSTGVSVVDINQDGLLDIYLCRVSGIHGLTKASQLLICKGIKNNVPYYANEAAAYNLDINALCTQAAFFDMDADGDLDMFLLNHSTHQNASFAPRASVQGTSNTASGDKLFENRNGKYIDVTSSSGISSTSIGYGLGLTVSDINIDGLPDIYVGNDFHENDYLYYNLGAGKFADKAEELLSHTSKFSMGVAAADLNNDGLPDIVSLDMLPSSANILKRSLGDDDFDVYQSKLQAGYQRQYSRNNLQWQRPNGRFSETGFYSGISATDWSWSPLLHDFNLDGKKDMFISNGIPLRLNDMDYVNFVYNESVQRDIHTGKLISLDANLLSKFPEIKLANKFYSNNGSLQFSDENNGIENDIPTFSNGAAVADFDRDGDLDIVVNNINDEALIYQNNTKLPQAVELVLQGPAANINAVGTKFIACTDSGTYAYEVQAVDGFMSSSRQPLLIPIKLFKADSVFLVWPDGGHIHVDPAQIKAGKIYYSYKPNLKKFDYKTHFKSTNVFGAVDSATNFGINFLHTENNFNDFDRQQLLPAKLSLVGPAVAVGDLNSDGLDDFFAGAASGFASSIFFQTAGGNFILKPQPELEADSACEDVAAALIDANKDGYKDLIVCGAGNEYYINDKRLAPRLYLNDGKGNFKKDSTAFSNVLLNASAIVVSDFDADGFEDVFLGASATPNAYGMIPQSYLLINTGKGKFEAITSWQQNVSNYGMVTSAIADDMNKDGRMDLIVCFDWGPVSIFLNNKDHLAPANIIAQNGWWRKVLIDDVDADGYKDVIALNEGNNHRITNRVAKPVQMLYGDFDANGTSEQVISYSFDGARVPYASKDELQRQMPYLKKRFLYAGDFADADFELIFSKNADTSVKKFEAESLSSVILFGSASGKYTSTLLPWQLQLAPLGAVTKISTRAAGSTTYLFAGNDDKYNAHNGRSDAEQGSLLTYNANRHSTYFSALGTALSGNVRGLYPIIIKGEQFILVANNNAALGCMRIHLPTTLPESK